MLKFPWPLVVYLVRRIRQWTLSRGEEEKEKLCLSCAKGKQSYHCLEVSAVVLVVT